MARQKRLDFDGSNRTPTDIYSDEFASWLTHQYRLAMAKGVQLGRRDTISCLVALTCIKRSLDRLWKAVHDGVYGARSLVGDETLRINDQFEELAKIGIKFD
jgi:hypothetical protein